MPAALGHENVTINARLQRGNRDQGPGNDEKALNLHVHLMWLST
jgi:hypothetical protein